MSVFKRRPGSVPGPVRCDPETAAAQEVTHRRGGKRLPALTTFCNTDLRALQIAHELHLSENPTVTVLYGSRARGDYAEGRSDVDILLVQEAPPTEEQEARVAFKALSLSASLYRGYRVQVQVVWLALEEFDKRRRRRSDFVSRVLDHGIILSESSTDYGIWSRHATASHHVRQAERHLRSFLDRQPGSEPSDHYVGRQAFAAMRDALKAVVFASWEWCPDVADIGMLIDLAARADAAFIFRPAIDADVYSQYGFPREGLPIDRPLPGIADYRALVEGDVRAALARVQVVRESWGP